MSSIGGDGNISYWAFTSQESFRSQHYVYENIYGYRSHAAAYTSTLFRKRWSMFDEMT